MERERRGWLEDAEKVGGGEAPRGLYPEGWGAPATLLCAMLMGTGRNRGGGGPGRWLHGLGKGGDRAERLSR